MGKEASGQPNYDIVAIITTDKDRLLGGKQLSLLAKDEEEGKKLTLEIARAMKADVVHLHTGDFLVIRV